MLWEVRNRMVTRLGHTAGTTRVLQVVTDGMKLAPVGPTILQERDAIIAAAAALPLAPSASLDVVDVREGFRVRGAGFSASIQNAGTGTNNTVVTEAFDFPNVQHINPFSVSDTTGNNNGFPEPGENVLLSVPVTNTTGATITNVLVNVNGGTNANYGTINDGQTVTQQIPFAIPVAAACGSTQNVNINVSSTVGAQTPVPRSFVLGNPQGIVQNFDGAVVPALPAGWTTTQDTGTSITWATTATGPSSAPNSAFANDPATVNMSSLVSPSVPITSAAAQLKFKNKYITEPTFDGMVLEMAIGAGAFQDIIAAGGSFVSGGYNATISSSFASPIAGRQAWSGTSLGGYIDTVVNLPAAANGNNVQFRWRMASDNSVSATGVNIDDVQIVSSFICAPTAADVEVSGRVLATAGGRGLRGARVVLRDESGNETSVFTGAYGTFRFPAVETGHTYILSVVSRRFQYAPQVLAINDNVTDLVFSPQ
ncbi:MAG: M36 family metallopeptidase [Chloracidobacterium sp.]|nr:M36 family metallopeptidase [Chloracidobacterium sp.]